MADFNQLFGMGSSASHGAEPATAVGSDGMGAALGTYDDAELLDLWSKIRKECIDTRMVFLRQWHRNILYVLNRQWIEYHNGVWKDKRLAQWVPRPITNKCKTTVQAIRAIFTAVQLGVNVRPNGSDPKNVAAASTADDLAPILHDTHFMNQTLMEFDFWLLTCGNAFLHTFVDYDAQYGMIDDPSETCQSCGATYKVSEIVQDGNVCPDCGGTSFAPAQDENGQPITNSRPKGRPSTIALSPLEIAFSNSYQRFKDLPYIVRLRWRTKTYYENHPSLNKDLDRISWEKGSGDISLQLYKALAQHNDLGMSPYAYMGAELQGSDKEDGITEYEVHYKPCEAYPDGLVFRVVGKDGNEMIQHLEDTEQIPGPLPYKDAKGRPLFTFTHAAYEHVGGRILGSGPIDAIIGKQDQLNQLDSMMLLHLNRMSNPAWIVPKGAGIGKLNGTPGLVVEWDALTLGGQGKPERLPGQDLNAGYFTLREQYLNDIEELAGTYDIIKGAKPTGVEAFSALQLLDERSKGRFTAVFQARGDAYADWFKFAIELEREFGPDERTISVQSSAKGWSFQNFKRADLQGDIDVIIENGSTAPKTTLGMRAALDHAVQMGFIDVKDPDQKYEALQLMGLTRMAPSLDIDVQSALAKQDAFEQWASNKQAMAASMQQMQQAVDQYMQQQQSMIAAAKQNALRTPPGVPINTAPPQMPPPPSVLQFTPLVWRSWYNPQIHMREFLKWTNGDSIRVLLSKNPQLAALLQQHQQEIQQAMPQPPVEAPKVNFAFNGQDMGDVLIRQYFEKTTGTMEPDGGTVQQGASKNAAEHAAAKAKEPQGAGSAMRGSNRESGNAADAQKGHEANNPQQPIAS